MTCHVKFRAGKELLLSTSGAKAYQQFIQEGVLVLKENHVRFPRVVILKCILKTFMQFINLNKFYK